MFSDHHCSTLVSFQLTLRSTVSVTFQIYFHPGIAPNSERETVHKDAVSCVIGPDTIINKI
jgi:hypothetical protein